MPYTFRQISENGPTNPTRCSGLSSLECPLYCQLNEGVYINSFAGNEGFLTFLLSRRAEEFFITVDLLAIDGRNGNQTKFSTPFKTLKVLSICGMKEN